MSDLRISGVVKAFGQVTAVAGVDVHVQQGHLLSLLGPSGCGKTTLLRMIAGLEQPDAGTIAIGGEDITDVPVNRRGIGMVFQSYALFPNMTAAENIGYGLRLRKWPRERIASRVGEMVDLIQIGDAAKRYPHQLSGGQQQRVALARALAIQPRVLLLDEPLSALDAQVRVALREGIRSIQQQLGITSVYVTHDQEEALSISDEVVVMRAGRIEQAGPPEELYGRPATPFVASFVGAANRLPATVTDRPAGLVAWGSAILHMADLGKGATLDHILVVVRPERIGVTRLADGDTSSAEQGAVDGLVEQRLFLGAASRLRVRTAAGDVVADAPTDQVPPERGDRVRLSFPPDACIGLADVRADVAELEEPMGVVEPTDPTDGADAAPIARA
ncbi:MAG: ABC transporter ATP-binding protein [Candidatus Limnocylindrales bacterium]